MIYLYFMRFINQFITQGGTTLHIPWKWPESIFSGLGNQKTHTTWPMGQVPWVVGYCDAHPSNIEPIGILHDSTIECNGIPPKNWGIGQMKQQATIPFFKSWPCIFDSEFHANFRVVHTVRHFLIPKKKWNPSDWQKSSNRCSITAPK